ncbi:MAG TPA: sigma 54-interacting transcriptional regulator [Polyangiaceae bacterium]|nr:sigma 54-interacting transcriptional regulator [Polyangiaceae bacterium]
MKRGVGTVHIEKVTGQETPVGDTAPTDETPGPVGERPRAAPGRLGLVTLFPLPEDELPPVWVVPGKRSVGRSRAAEIRIDDTRVSRVHATLEPSAEGLYVEDRGSRHGTFLCGKRIARERVLAPWGSILRVGDQVFLVCPDVERFHARPRRAGGSGLGLRTPIVAGPALARVWDEATRAASQPEGVVILGETGSGKECIARIIHASRREPGPFVGINVNAIPEPLFEAELFGYERGAFTGAVSAKPGAFREAAGGVLFLDEVGDLKLEGQAKLLRALDQRQVRPLGSNRDASFDAAIVAATSVDLWQACERGSFRADLFYRLAGVVIRVPPLRERPGDVILLALESLGQREPSLRLSADVAEALVTRRWEGNARELRHVVGQAAHAAASAGHAELALEHLPATVDAPPEEDGLTRERLEAALARSGGVVARAARALGVSRTTFYKAMKRFGMEPRASSEPC